ncbi:uncharacterized protein LOC114650041 isoform X2 [Erpetoichthys calabaricus]|uniref:uncharacterized protein LOC114650041 isoform X2 n=1 Tax=Erpetoichthys calabaricus TaxID=27687 RepID=UPI0022344323|nr:uncharacterized protein LOC114650041 isoform X2 [Erpetoichthys calabaricus]
MDGVGSTFGLITQIVNIKMKILFLLCIGNFFSGSVFGQLKIVTVPSLEGYSHGDINLPCSASLNRNDIKLMWITWIQNTQKVYEYDGYNAKHIVELPGYNVDLKQVQQGDIALTISRNTLTPGVYTFKCEVTEGSFEGRGETTLTIRGSIFGQLKVVTVPSLEGYSDGDINLPCNASLNRKNIKLMRITWIQNAVKVYEYDGSTATHIVKIPGYNVDLKQVQQGDVALTIARNILTPGVYTFKCEVREGSSEDRGETTLTVKAPPQILTVNAARSVTVKELPYDLTCSVPNLRWNKVEKMTLTWKENGKDLCFFDGSNSDAQQSKKCHCVKSYPSLCLLSLTDAHISDVNYTCIVTEGNAEGSATIAVKFKD